MTFFVAHETANVPIFHADTLVTRGVRLPHDADIRKLLTIDGNGSGLTRWATKLARKIVIIDANTVLCWSGTEFVAAKLIKRLRELTGEYLHNWTPKVHSLLHLHYEDLSCIVTRLEDGRWFHIYSKESVSEAPLLDWGPCFVGGSGRGDIYGFLNHFASESPSVMTTGDTANVETENYVLRANHIDAALQGECLIGFGLENNFGWIIETVLSNGQSFFHFKETTFCVWYVSDGEMSGQPGLFIRRECLERCTGLGIHNYYNGFSASYLIAEPGDHSQELHNFAVMPFGAKGRREGRLVVIISDLTRKTMHTVQCGVDDGYGEISHDDPSRPPTFSRSFLDHVWLARGKAGNQAARLEL